MGKLFLCLSILLGLGVEAVMAQSCPPGPPQSRYDGSTDGTPLPNGGSQFNFKYAKTAGFDCFELLRAWFPQYLDSSHAISPNHTVLNMAYAIKGTATFFNVVVARKGNYTLAVRYAYNFGHFPGITDRPQGIRVNGVVITYDMHFPITYDFENYEYSDIVVPLNAGKNTIEFFNVTDHGVARMDTMVITASTNTLCSDSPSTPGGLTALATNKRVSLKWTSSNWPADCAIRYYDVYRGTTSGFIPSASNRIASGITTLSYADKAVLCDTTYYYLVQAVSTPGASASRQADARTGHCSSASPDTADERQSR